MSYRIQSIQDVAARQLCTGCGVCSYMQPEAIRMTDVVDQGRRPLLKVIDGRLPDTSEALRACPGIELGHGASGTEQPVIKELSEAWGPVLEVWEGYATDAEVRLAASSGGAATALALHCLEEEDMYGVVHIAGRADVPYLNETVMSQTRGDLLAATGSRYAPASPGDGLKMVEDSPRPCVFIGKPCDVAGVHRARALRPQLDRRLGLTVAVFCAGTPTLAGTLEMMQQMGIKNFDTVTQVRYRGNGWPGQAEVRTLEDGEERVRQLSYDESWGEILQKHRQWRCHVCADHTGEFADIAVGDPWYREITDGEPGRSLLLVRTERGRRILRAAVEAGLLAVTPAEPSILAKSQPNLYRGRGSLWGRLLTCRLLGVPAPSFRNMSTFPIWWRELDKKQKLRSFTGTARRVFRRRLLRPVKLEPYEAVLAEDAP